MLFSVIEGIRSIGISCVVRMKDMYVYGYGSDFRVYVRNLQITHYHQVDFTPVVWLLRSVSECDSSKNSRESVAALFLEQESNWRENKMWRWWLSSLMLSAAWILLLKKHIILRVHKNDSKCIVLVQTHYPAISYLVFFIFQFSILKNIKADFVKWIGFQKIHQQ